jgi:hypothetical protein
MSIGMDAKASCSAGCVTGLLLWALSFTAARAEPPPNGASEPARQGALCAGCELHVPVSYSPERPAPLLVVLHGDEGNPAKVLAVWKGAAEARGVILFAPKCPRDNGCTTGSFWRWGGSPAWLVEQTGILWARYRIDPSRVYLSGWSGGATYMGMLAPHFGTPFTALNLNGGGHPPTSLEACAACALPVYYLAGDRNPLHHLAVLNRDYYQKCRHDVHWHLLPGKNHAGELLALSTPAQTLAILDWMEKHARRCDPIETVTSANADPGVRANERSASEPFPTALPVDEVKPVRVRPEAAQCGCASTAPAAAHESLVLLFAAMLVARRARRARAES